MLNPRQRRFNIKHTTKSVVIMSQRPNPIQNSYLLDISPLATTQTDSSKDTKNSNKVVHESGEHVGHSSKKHFQQ